MSSNLWRRRLVAEAWAAPGPVRKEDAPCCVSKRDEFGRLPIAFCSPKCERRPS